MTIKGTVLKYTQNEDDINTDVIWPGKYTYIQIMREEMYKYAMETYDPEFKEKVKGNNILVVGKNFGCGSSREQASECLKYSGVKAIIARSFARIFYRNSINIGLPVIESPEAVDALEQGDSLEIDLGKGIITVMGEDNTGKEITIPKYPPFVMALINDEGLINHIRKKVDAGKYHE